MLLLNHLNVTKEKCVEAGKGVKYWEVSPRVKLVKLEQKATVEEPFFPGVHEHYVVIQGNPHLKVGDQRASVISPSNAILLKPNETRRWSNEFVICAIFWVIGDRAPVKKPAQ